MSFLSLVERSRSKSTVLDKKFAKKSDERQDVLWFLAVRHTIIATLETTTGTATTDAQEFIEASRVFLKQDFLPKLLYCLEKMSDEDIWWRPNEKSNSAGNLVLHLRGNLKQWIVVSLGGGSFKRDRDAEFSARGPVPKAELIAGIRSTVEEGDEVLKGLPEDLLLGHRTIQNCNTSALQAIYHVTEHFSYHLGQILYVYKLRTGMDPAF